MAGNTNFTSLISTTLQHLPKEIFSNVVTNNALLNILMQQGNVRVVPGGRQFTHPLRHKLNNTFAARSRTAVIPLTAQDHLTRSTWEVRVIDGSISLNEVELAMNSGDKEKLIDLAEEMKDSAVESLTEIMGDQVFNTAVDTAVDIDSIPRIIAETPTAQTDIGGITNDTASGNSYWSNQTYATTVTGFATSQEGLNAMDTLLNNCIFGRRGPTVIITTKANYTRFGLALQANQRFTNADQASGGFRNLLYTQIPVYFDDNCPTGDLFMIDTTAIRFQVLEQMNMKIGEFREAEAQLIKTALVSIACNITAGERRTSGRMNSITG